MSDASIIFELRKADGSIRTVEDPRIVHHDGTWHMFYTLEGVDEDPACPAVHSGGAERVKQGVRCLALATTRDITDRSAWTNHGALFPNVGGYQWSKSGAVAVRSGTPADPHMLIFGSWNILTPDWVSPIYMPVAFSTDLIHWSMSPAFLMERREGHPDAYVIEPGAPPLRLNDGNLLFVYNGAVECETYDPSYKRCYNVLWAVLDGKNPSVVVARADAAILEPALAWEGHNSTIAATPNVVFVETLVPWPLGSGGGGGGGGGGAQRFRGWYGGGDMDVGALEVEVARV